MRDGLALAIAASFSWGCSSSSNSDGAASASSDDVPRYRLTNSFLGTDAALVAGAVASEPPTTLGFTTEQSDERVQWSITPLDSGFYRITNRALGETLSLDIVNDASLEQLTMAETSDQTGQRWLITLLDNGFCRFTTDFLGPDRALDSTADADTQAQPVIRPTGDFSGQFWQASVLGGDADPVLANCDGEPG